MILPVSSATIRFHIQPSGLRHHHHSVQPGAYREQMAHVQTARSLFHEVHVSGASVEHHSPTHLQNISQIRSCAAGRHIQRPKATDSWLQLLPVF